jgi:hypothetical protein
MSVGTAAMAAHCLALPRAHVGAQAPTVSGILSYPILSDKGGGAMGCLFEISKIIKDRSTTSRSAFFASTLKQQICGTQHVHKS